jgi:hypothetical protein
VCFGVAPALVVYVWALIDLGKLGWIASFIYCAGAALRLARFNTNIDVVDKRFFQGLPSPRRRPAHRGPSIEDDEETFEDAVPEPDDSENEAKS